MPENSHDAPPLVRVGSIFIPRMGFVVPNLAIRAGEPGYKGVGDKLAEILPGRFGERTREACVDVFRLEEPSQVLDSDLARLGGPYLDFRHVHGLHQDEDNRTSTLIATGSQVGFWGHALEGPKACRSQINWKEGEGHTIGGVPDPLTEWIWKAGTFFIVYSQ